MMKDNQTKQNDKLICNGCVSREIEINKMLTTIDDLKDKFEQNNKLMQYWKALAFHYKDGRDPLPSINLANKTKLKLRVMLKKGVTSMENGIKMVNSFKKSDENGVNEPLTQRSSPESLRKRK